MIRSTVFTALVIVLIASHMAKMNTVDQIEAIRRCINSTEIDEFQAHKIGIDLLLTDDDITKSFIICLSNELGIRNAEGTMQFDTIRKYLTGLTDEEVDAVIGTCEHVKGTDKTDTSYLVIKCVFKEIRNVLSLTE